MLFISSDLSKVFVNDHSRPVIGPISRMSDDNIMSRCEILQKPHYSENSWFKVLHWQNDHVCGMMTSCIGFTLRQWKIEPPQKNYYFVSLDPLP